MTSHTDLYSAVRDAYGARAREVIDGAPGARAGGVASTLYGDVTSLMPDSLVSYGCGNPVAIAGLRAGEAVLDLGSGAGLDCFLSARQVGPTGAPPAAHRSKRHSKQEDQYQERENKS